MLFRYAARGMHVAGAEMAHLALELEEGYSALRVSL